MYRCHLHPNTFSDVNGQYIGFDRQVHVAQGYTHYANYSIWDTYRTWVQLGALLDPDRTSQMMHSLLVDAQECGGAMPRWPVANTETGTMEEGSATPLVCSAFSFGARVWDLERAF
jgi:putative alpha-1,2-mannosidase